MKIDLRVYHEGKLPEDARVEQYALPLTIGSSPNNTIHLDSSQIAAKHATITSFEGEAKITTVQQNVIFYRGKQKTAQLLKEGMRLAVGDYIIDVLEFSDWDDDDDDEDTTGDATLLYTEDSDHEQEIEKLDSFIARQSAPVPEFPPPYFANEIVAVDDIRNGPHEVDEVTYLAVGGGVGSFVFVDHLVIYGANPKDIVSIGNFEKPYGRYQQLCRNSQIPPHERLRSNSDSCPDNIWGYPGYGMREMYHDVKRGKVGNALKVAWTLFAEPILADAYTPRSQDVFDYIDVEARRIGWDKIWRYGSVRGIRKTDDGRYVVAYSQTRDRAHPIHKLIIANYLHLSIGYPASRFLDDLRNYREETHDFYSVVNAYEAHDHIYKELEKNGGTVMLRGRGIVSSRILQRIAEAREINPNIKIIHLMRYPKTKGNTFRGARRVVENHWEFQPYNWPKSTWSGSGVAVLEKASPQERAEILTDWGGTTTARRADWRRIVKNGQKQGWYQIVFGSVDSLEKDNNDVLNAVIIPHDENDPHHTMKCNYIIDGTGLVADISTHSILKDLLDTYDLQRNPKGRLDVSSDFEVYGMENGKGKMYASGIITLGGPYAPVDSFLGLQFTGQRAADALAKNGAPGVKYLNGLQSVKQWLRWARGERP